MEHFFALPLYHLSTGCGFKHIRYLRIVCTKFDDPKVQRKEDYNVPIMYFCCFLLSYKCGASIASPSPKYAYTFVPNLVRIAPVALDRNIVKCVQRFLLFHYLLPSKNNGPSLKQNCTPFNQ